MLSPARRSISRSLPSPSSILRMSPTASSMAAGRLATVQRHLATTSSSSSSDSTSTGGTGGVKRITVFGAGLMGAGIAQIGAQNGFKVVLSDVTDQALKNGMTIITKSLGRIAKKSHPNDVEGFTKSITDNIETTTDAAQAVKEADLVVEAIIESIKVKQDLFGFLDREARYGKVYGAETRDSCIFATNTSSLSVTEIASSCRDSRQAKFAGLHFFNPVPAMKLVEVIRTPQTSNETYETLRNVTLKMGKAPVTCKDTPGFIVNRLLVPYMLEAIRMVERGDATPEDVDQAMELGAGYQVAADKTAMGPFKLLDFVGLDTTSYIATGWREKAAQGDISEELVRPIPMLEEMVKDGRMGRKSGRGFYDYEGKK